MLCASISPWILLFGLGLKLLSITPVKRFAEILFQFSAVLAMMPRNIRLLCVRNNLKCFLTGHSSVPRLNTVHHLVTPTTCRPIMRRSLIPVLICFDGLADCFQSRTNELQPKWFIINGRRAISFNPNVTERVVDRFIRSTLNFRFGPRLIL